MQFLLGLEVLKRLQQSASTFSTTLNKLRNWSSRSLFAEKYFDLEMQASKLANVYKTACKNFDPMIAREIWQTTDINTPVTQLLARKLNLLADRKKQQLSAEVSEILESMHAISA